MKLNYRDKIVLTVLIVVFVWVAGVMFFIKPAIEDVQSAQNQLESAKVTLADLEAKIEADKDLDQRIEDAYKETKVLVTSFYTYQEAQDATQLIDDLLDTDELVNSSMTISGYGGATLSPYSYTKPIILAGMDSDVLAFEESLKPAEEVEEEITEEVDPDAPVLGTVAIGSYSISFNFVGDFEKIMSFCDKLKNSNTEKTIIVQNLTFPHSNSKELTNDDEQDASLSVMMYVLRELPDPKVS